MRIYTRSLSIPTNVLGRRGPMQLPAPFAYFIQKVCQDSITSRKYRHDFRRLWGFGTRSQAANPAANDEFRQAAGSGRHSVNVDDPYLTREPFENFVQVQEKNGSSGRTRTYNPPVNSRMLCH